MRNNLFLLIFLSSVANIICDPENDSATDDGPKSEVAPSDEEKYPLHKYVFEDDSEKLSTLLPSHDVAQKDKHGNTALHLAVMLGRKECIRKLLEHKAPVEVTNLNEWNVLAEALSYGDREIITSVLRQQKYEQRESIANRRPVLAKQLKEMPNFKMEMDWDVRSWLLLSELEEAFFRCLVPLISRLFPSDVCKIWKYGSKVRFDYTIVDFKDRKYERGDLSFLFDGEAPLAESAIFMDNAKRVYQKVVYEKSDFQIKSETNKLMTNGIMNTVLLTESMKFTTTKCGWVFKSDKKEMVGPYLTDCYSEEGLVIRMNERQEHLSEKDRKKKSGTELFENIVPEDTELKLVPSLNPPPLNSVTWREYIDSEPGKHPNLGRKQVIKKQDKNFKASVAMSRDFPLSSEDLVHILEVIEQCNRVTGELRKFIEKKLLPEGVPIKLDIPLFPTVYATVFFRNYEKMEKVDEDYFKLPPTDYTEDPKRFLLA